MYKNCKKKILIVLAVIMSLVIIPFSSSANSTVPVITYPTQYQEVYPETALTFRWNAPSTGTVLSYCISVRELTSFGEESNKLIRDKVIVSSSTRSMTLTASEMHRNGSYRISVSANMSDGTVRWSLVRNFHTALGRPIPSGHTISLKIYTGYSTAFKDAIYYSTRTWIDVMSQEKVNTYPYNQGTSNLEYDPNDSENVVIPFAGSAWGNLMTVVGRRDSSGRIINADVLINSAFSWSTNVASGTYDVQNIMTHEVGHILGLSDKYESYAIGWTMYGRGSPQQIDQRSLANQDIAALYQLYP
ncbi:MAG: matrixin family metalloprotease [Clostridia bacterium]|nr:matrixin family metalloprotease [Clostridia bacterium]